LTGMSARRPLPRWSARPFRLRDGSPSPRLRGEGRGEGQRNTPTSLSVPAPHPHPNPLPVPEESRGEGTREAALLADTFNRYFEPENLEAAVAVLGRLGYRVGELRAQPGDGARPLCCGRTFLSAGLVEEARAEARRLLAAAAPFLARGVPIVGLEPS